MLDADKQYVVAGKGLVRIFPSHVRTGRRSMHCGWSGWWRGFAVDASLIQADVATLDDGAWGAATDVVPKFVSPYPIRQRSGPGR
jgi:hypothetical protein